MVFPVFLHLRQKKLRISVIVIKFRWLVAIPLRNFFLKTFRIGPAIKVAIFLIGKIVFLILSEGDLVSQRLLQKIIFQRLLFSV